MEKQRKYKFIEDLTSDVMFEAYGHDLSEVFANAALAMFSVICQVERIEPKKSLNVELKADNVKELMFNWLQRLIVLVDLEEMFFSRFEIIEIGERHLHAKVWGEDADPAKGGTLAKAVTYYKFKFAKISKGYVARVSLDI